MLSSAIQCSKSSLWFRSSRLIGPNLKLRNAQKQSLKLMCTNGKSNCLQKELEAKIRFSGPLTVYEYMKEVLTNPLSGYYSGMKSNVIGVQGDFITSPEISQMFGELIGIWLYYEWFKMGAQKPFQLIELGPGTGALMQDILRTLKQLKIEKDDIQIHLIEMSPHMCKLQEERLCGITSGDDLLKVPDDSQSDYKSGITTEGHLIHWHYHLSLVPKHFAMIIAHEFFDALPIHKLKRTEDGWREVLVDIQTDKMSNYSPDEGLRFVLSPGPTLASRLYVDPLERRDEIEVSPDSGVLIQELSARIKENGGAVLIMDYGHDGTLSDTFRAFKNHEQVSPLHLPGSCDLTADVDFSYIRKKAADTVLCYGPVSQRLFLRNLGIEIRLQELLRNCDRKAYESLIRGYKMLIDPSHMGERFKMMALLPMTMRKLLIEHPVTGFFRTFDNNEE